MIPDIRIIAESDDAIAKWLAEAAALTGRSTSHITHSEAAQEMTIYIKHGMCCIDPEIPTFFRLPTGLPPQTEEHVRFHWGERLSTVWAGLALCRSRVVNRPSRFGMVGKFSRSLRVNCSIGAVGAPMEVFASPLPPLAILPGNWWAEDMKTNVVEPLSLARPGEGAYCLTKAVDTPTHELVVVVGQKAFRANLSAEDFRGIETKSVEIIAALDLTFAAIGWELDLISREMRPIAIHPHPQPRHLEARWNEISTELLRFLLE